MSLFELSKEFDKNKIFLINLSDIDKRLDPYYHKEEFKIIEEKLSKVDYTFFNKATIKIFSGITPKSKGNAYTTQNNGIAFVRSGNFSQDNIINFDKLNYIKNDIHNKVMKSSKLQKGDLLIAIVGATIGKVGIYNYDIEANINQAICAVRFKDDFLSNFVHIYLLTPLGQKIIDKLKRPVARANINLEEIGSIPLPIIDVTKQESIIKFYYSKIKVKQQKEKQAKELLESIDTYLLDELGITLPEIDNSLEKRIFEVKLSDISGIRFDPDYKSKIDNLTNLTWKYPLSDLKGLMIGSAQYGANETAQEYKTGNVRYIRITDIDEIGTLKEYSMKTANNIQDQYTLNHNDILFARSGSVGQCYIHKDIKNKAIFAGYLIRFILDDKKINLDYFFYYCHSSIYKYWVSAIERPAVQSNINSEEYKSLKVPIPPIKKQNEIAEHIQNTRDKAKQLKLEAIQDLENAKTEVEKMILGS